jgi:hypothetical protein
MSFASEMSVYVGRVREFDERDWVGYLAWVGLMAGLVLSTGGFLLFGHHHGARFPAEAWMVPIGAGIFTASIALDSIGHRTKYRHELRGGEGLVHAITILCGIASCVLLCAAYSRPHALWIPAMVTTALSFFYSFVDEAFHWKRYVEARSDRVEMWSHVGILTGHATMMLGWWTWFFQGYAGVAETLRFLEMST